MFDFFQDLYQRQFGPQDDRSLKAASAEASAQPGVSASTSEQYQLQQLTSTSSAIFSIAAAGVRAGDLEKQAGDQLIMAEAERAATLHRSNAILRHQMEVSGALRAAFAASGVDLGSQSVQLMDRDNRRNAQSALMQTRNAGARRVAQRRNAAKALTRRAAESFGAGVIDATLAAAQGLATGGAG